jgi:hypothetical protein
VKQYNQTTHTVPNSLYTYMVDTETVPKIYHMLSWPLPLEVMWTYYVKMKGTNLDWHLFCAWISWIRFLTGIASK